jgi:hypothetical protein
MSSWHVILHDEENKPRKENSNHLNKCLSCCRQCGLVDEAMAVGDGAATVVAEVD